MKTIYGLVIMAVTIFTAYAGHSQDNPLTYIESSVGLNNPEWEGGDSELEFADINQDEQVDIVSLGDYGNRGMDLSYLDYNGELSQLLHPLYGNDRY